MPNLNKKQSFFLLSALLLLLLGALAYLSLLRGWGFYKDDWHFIWTGHAFGTSGIFQLFTLDRPFMGVVYAITYRILGENPLAWQVSGFIIRMFSVFAFWWLASMIWKGRRHLVLLMAAIFILYPGFLQQPNAGTFQNHFIGYTAAILSIAFSFKAISVSSKPYKALLITASVLLTFFYLMIYEYMIGLEIVRFFLLDYGLQNTTLLPLKKRLFRIVRTFLPYLLAVGLFLVWRLVIFNSTRAATDPGLIGAMYLHQPFEMVLRLVLESFKDIFAVMVSAWVVPFYQTSETLDYRSFLYAVLAGLIGMVGWIFVSQKHLENHQENENSPKTDAIFLFTFGTVLALVTLLPILLANRDVHFSDQFDRYTLQATLGVAIAFGGLLDGINRITLRRWVIAGFLGISLVTQVCNGIVFQRFWSAQKQLWWQLAWRAPGIKKDTTLVALLPSGARLAEGYEIWGPANRIYYPDEKNIVISAEILNQETLGWIQSRQSYGRVFRTLEYTVDFKNSLIVTLPGNGSCLHVLRGDIQELSGNEEAAARLIAPVSRLEMIQLDAQDTSLPAKLFGAEPEHRWCYYYQRISLERQRKNWVAAANLADEAFALGLTPLDQAEWLPLYESYFRTGNMERANELGGILRATPDFIAPYCSQFTPQQIHQISQDTTLAFIIQNICPDFGTK